MAPPTITGITPVSGLSSGQTLVTIDGTNFEIDPTVALMEVKFGTALGKDVRVLTSSKLTVLTPTGTPGGIVDVSVKNLTTLESVTTTGAYSYNRPDLSCRSHLAHLIKTLIQELKKQIIASVSLTTNTDYDRITSDALNITELSTLPHLLIIGPNLPVNRTYSTNVRPTSKSGGTTTVSHEPFTTDLEFTIAGVDDHPERIFNLLSTTVNFFQKNELLAVDRDPLDPGQGQVSYELNADFEGFGHNTNPNIFNVHSFDGSFTIRGFMFEVGETVEQAFDIAQEILTTELFTP